MAGVRIDDDLRKVIGYLKQITVEITKALEPEESPPADPDPGHEKGSHEFLHETRKLVRQIRYKENYRLLCERDQKDSGGRVYLQVECDRPDATTGAPGTGRGGKMYLSEHMTRGEIVRKAFQLFMAYEEHECREFFRWRGRAVFGPHIDAEALWEVANRLDVRP